MVQRGLPYREKVHGMNLVGIYAKNRIEWYATDWACALFGVTSVPLYDTLGKDNLTYCLNQTEMTTLFLSAPCMKVLMALEDIGNLRTLVCYDHLEDIDEASRNIAHQRGLSVLHFSDLIKHGKGLTDITNANIKISKEDTYTFSYTSGTTGPPKGVMLSHKNLMAMFGGLDHYSPLSVDHTDTHVS